MKVKLAPRFFIFLLCLFISTHSTLAQKTIHGTITDTDGESLIGAGILIKGTTIGTVSDVDGTYSLESPDSMPILIISYTGYATKEIKVTNPEEANIILSEGMELSEVVVTGLGIRRSEKSRGYGASTISSSSISGVSSRGSYSGRSKRSTSKKRKKRKSAKKGAFMAVDGVPIGDKSAKVSSSTSSTSAGLLTAGEINDFQKWDLWQDVAKEDLEEWQKLWQFKPLERYMVQLSNENGFPVMDIEVILRTKEGKILFRAKTDNTGKAELWASLRDGKAQNSKNLQILVKKEGQEFLIKKANAFQNGINHLKLAAPCISPTNLDIMMVVDATGSMGDEIAYLKTELEDVINQAQKNHNSLTINLGSVFYRDHGDEYLTRKSDFSTDISKTVSFIQKQSADGGGDGPEAVESALSVAIDSMEWSEEAVARILFLVLDAPPHNTPEIKDQLHQLSAKAAQKGIKIIPITGSGINKSTEYLMRCLSLTTNGTYLFLTDHSGVGGAHIEPTTDSYDVELLTALMLRLIDQNSKLLNCDNPTASLNTKIDKVAKSDRTKLEKDLKLKLYPNPTAGPVNIEMKTGIEELLITDISGKILERRAKWSKGKHKIDLVQYPSGIYFFQFKTKEGILSKKIIVEHNSFIAKN